MQIITAPSKTQQTKLDKTTEVTTPKLLSKSQQLIECLCTFNKEELSALMKTSEKLTLSTLQKIQAFNLPFTPENAAPALFTFQGDAYDAIAAETYSEKELAHAQDHLFILSGLYGALRPLDLMQQYRLEMGLKLEVGKNANLYAFWREEVTGVINQAMTEDDDKILINLASQEYAKVVDKKKLKGRMVTIVFKQPHRGGLKTIPIHSKRARGLMIHYMISTGISIGEELKAFDLDGYSFAPSMSDDLTWTFAQRSS